MKTLSKYIFEDIKTLLENKETNRNIKLIELKGRCIGMGIDTNNPTSPIYFEPITSKVCVTYRRNNYYYYI